MLQVDWVGVFVMASLISNPALNNCTWPGLDLRAAVASKLLPIISVSLASLPVVLGPTDAAAGRYAATTVPCPNKTPLGSLDYSLHNAGFTEVALTDAGLGSDLSQNEALYKHYMQPPDDLRQ